MLGSAMERKMLRRGTVEYYKLTKAVSRKLF